MSVTEKLKNAGLWQSLQVIVQTIAQFGYLAIMARLLSKSDFGLMAIAGSFIGFGILFSEAGMGASLIQRKKTTDKHNTAALQGSFILGTLVFLIFYFSAKPIASFFEQPILELIIKVAGATIILNSISSVSISLLQKKFQFRQTSLVIAASSVIGYGTGVFLGLNNWGVWSLVTASIASSLISAIALFLLAPVKVSFKLHLREWKELFSFGSGIILLKINNYLGNQGVNLILGRIFLPAQLGIFERSNQIKNLPGGYLGNILDTIMFPTMSEIQDDKEKLFRIYQHSLGIVNTLLIPLSFYLIFFSKEIVDILLGSQWQDAVVPLQIMLIVLPFASSSRMADSVIRAKGLVYKNVRRKFLFVTVLMVSVFTGGYYYGIPGAAIGVTFSYLFNYCIMLFLVKRIFEKSPGEIFIRPLIAGLKLSALVFALTIFITLIFNNWSNHSIIKFIITTILVALIIIIIALKKPSILGIYCNEFIETIFKKKMIVKDRESENQRAVLTPELS